jgi:hypothetical protein
VEVEDALDYYNTTTIMDVKSFLALAPAVMELLSDSGLLRYHNNYGCKKVLWPKP